LRNLPAGDLDNGRGQPLPELRSAGETEDRQASTMDAMMQDLGMVKLRGAMGGVYWE
jgi:hypothetical protein